MVTVVSITLSTGAGAELLPLAPPGLCSDGAAVHISTAHTVDTSGLPGGSGVFGSIAGSFAGQRRLAPSVAGTVTHRGPSELPWAGWVEFPSLVGLPALPLELSWFSGAVALPALLPAGPPSSATWADADGSPPLVVLPALPLFGLHIIISRLST